MASAFLWALFCLALPLGNSLTAAVLLPVEGAGVPAAAVAAEAVLAGAISGCVATAMAGAAAVVRAAASEDADKAEAFSEMAGTTE